MSATRRRVVAVIDGEHYPPVVRDALDVLEQRGDDVVAAVLVGGTEKLRGGDGYGVPLAPSLDHALEGCAPDVVVDLSDEPVLGPVERLELAGRVLARGVAYEGPGFRFDPPLLVQGEIPTLAVVGTGKRVGKTAVTGHLSRHLGRDRSVVVVAMGRGGPPAPELVRVPPTVAELLARSRAGRHAASDHLETAVATGVTTVGARRCGGGLAGGVFVSNVVEAYELAAGLAPDLVVLDGSGAAIPPVRGDRVVLVAPSHQDPAVAGGYLNGFRALLADLVVVTMAEADSGHDAVAAALARAAPPGTPVVQVVLRPRPLESVRGERVAWFGAAPEGATARIARHLEEEHEARVVHASSALSDRTRLRAELAGIDAETFVVELKAAAVDVVAEEAARRGVRVVVATNDVVPVPGGPSFDEELERLADEVCAAAGAAA